MKRNVPFWQFAGFCLVSLGGTLLHFAYEWSGNSVLAAPFSGVNESTWEHMKLLYFPMVLFALFQSRFFRDYRGFWWVKLAGLLTGLVWIPVLFYTYNGAFGRSPDWLNIAIYFVAVAAAFWTEYRLFRRGVFSRLSSAPAVGVVVLIGALFAVFTFATPEIPLFRDPLTGTYGIEI